MDEDDASPPWPSSPRISAVAAGRVAGADRARPSGAHSSSSFSSQQPLVGAASRSRLHNIDSRNHSVHDDDLQSAPPIRRSIDTSDSEAAIAMIIAGYGETRSRRLDSDLPRMSAAGTSSAAISPVRIALSPIATCAAMPTDAISFSFEPAESSDRGRRTQFSSLTINTCLINGTVVSAPGSKITSNDTTLIADSLFAACLIRLIYLLESLPEPLAIPRFSIIAAALLTTHALLFTDLDALVSKDNVSNTLFIALRLVVLIGASWAGLTAFNSLQSGRTTFMVYMAGSRLLCVLVLLLVAIKDGRCRMWCLMRCTASLIVATAWVLGLVMTPRFGGWDETIWSLSLMIEVLTTLVFAFVQRRLARRGSNTAGMSESAGLGVPVFKDWNTQVRARHVRLVTLVIFAGGVTSMFPVRRGVGEVAATLIPHDMGPFAVTVVGLLVLYALDRCHSASAASVLFEMSLCGVNQERDLHDVKSRADPPLSTLWRLLQIPLTISVILTVAGVKFTLQSLYDGYNGIAGFSPSLPPAIFNNTTALLNATDYAHMLLNDTSTPGDPDSFYPNNLQPDFYWDQKRGETLLSLGLACCVLLCAFSSVVLSLSSHLTRFGVYMPPRMESSGVVVTESLDDKPGKGSVIGWRISSDADEEEHVVDQVKAIDDEHHCTKHNAILKSAEIASEVDEFWRDVWPVASHDSSVRSRNHPMIDSIEPSGPVSSNSAPLILSAVHNSLLRWDVMGPLRGRARGKGAGIVPIAADKAGKKKQGRVEDIKKSKPKSSDASRSNETFCNQIEIERDDTGCEVGVDVSLQLQHQKSKYSALVLAINLARHSLLRLLLVCFLIGAVPSANLLTKIAGAGFSNSFSLLGADSSTSAANADQHVGDAVGLWTLLLCAFAMTISMVAEEVRRLQSKNAD